MKNILQKAWVGLIASGVLLVLYFNQDFKKVVVIDTVKENKRWDYQLPQWLNITDLQCNMLIEGVLDDTASIELTYVVSYQPTKRVKSEHPSVSTDTVCYKYKIPPGQVRAYAYWEYAAPVKISYNAYKAQKGNLKITLLKGYWNPTEGWRCLVL
ncbi:MAG: hypothetical protein ACK4GN_05120 [Runella sp.]